MVSSPSKGCPSRSGNEISLVIPHSALRTSNLVSTFHSLVEMNLSAGNDAGRQCYEARQKTLDPRAFLRTLIERGVVGFPCPVDAIAPPVPTRRAIMLTNTHRTA